MSLRVREIPLVRFFDSNRPAIPAWALLVLILVAMLAPLRLGAQGGESAPERSVTVPIVLFHHLRAPRPDATPEERAMEVAPDAFESSMRWLVERGFHSVSMADVADALDGRRALPSNPIVISFDDGFEEDFVVALPILERLGLKATFYVYPFALGRPERLTWEELRALDHAGMEIGSHTLTHPHLPELGNADLLHEVIDSRAELERFLGHPVTTFAYPYGEHDARVDAAVSRAGYRTATTVVPGTAQRASEHFALHRFVVTPDATLEALASAFVRDGG